MTPLTVPVLDPAATPGIRGRARFAVPTTPRPLIPGFAASTVESPLIRRTVMSSSSASAAQSPGVGGL
ncbi:hypothetical protein [Paenarthrobacter sp. 2TAF44]|uniref:hypothetical protein n=1 Tax=Paenarthrobacter sp. 2TAF44 TaxID=3233018 RepID=UPI003F99BD13